MIFSAIIPQPLARLPWRLILLVIVMCVAAISRCTANAVASPNSASRASAGPPG